MQCNAYIQASSYLIKVNEIAECKKTSQATGWWFHGNDLYCGIDIHKTPWNHNVGRFTTDKTSTSTLFEFYAMPNLNNLGDESFNRVSDS